MISRANLPLQDYSAEESLTWLYLMSECIRRTRSFAHPTALKGLEELGLLSATIPKLEVLNQRLLGLGWELVPVVGFFPPRDYLGHLANRKLPVSVNMRCSGNLSFNAEPDIFHEVFGHVSMLIDPDYRRFLQDWGKASLCAFQSPGEQDFYESIRSKAELKSVGAESPNPTKPVESEATRLARLGWWTVECGVLKSQGKLFAYGAAILSSLKEIEHFSKTTQVFPSDSDSLNTPFDPTEVQPQYFLVLFSNTLTRLREKWPFRQEAHSALRLRFKAENLQPVCLLLGARYAAKFSLSAFQDPMCRLL
jgi:phenylalanine-4-hydroxylase